MKIAMIGHKRIPGREGGIEVVVEELSARLASLGNDVVVYNRRKKAVAQPKQYKGVKIEVVPTIEKKSMDAAVYALLASVRAVFGGYDVIHYHAIGPGFFLLIPHLFHIRTVVTVHGLNYKTPKWRGVGAGFLQAGERITAKYADRIIVLSREQQRYFWERYRRETCFIPNGTVREGKAEADIIRRRFGLKSKGYVLFVSRVVPGKGLEYLLEAYRQVETGLPLVIAGNSAYAEGFYRKIREKAALDPRVKMVGFVEGRTLRELYSNAALFVFPSEAEGMSMCLLEALSYDCRCLVSDIAENVEVGREFVKTFRSGDVQDLKEKMERCLEDLETEPPASGDYIEKNYEWDSIVRRTLECYEGIEKRC